MKNKILLLLCLLLASMVLVSCPEVIDKLPEVIESIGSDSSRTFVFRGFSDTEHEKEISKKENVDSNLFKAFGVSLWDGPGAETIMYYALKVPEGMKTVRIFSNKDNFAEIKLPEGVEEVEVYCGRVMKMNIPSTLKKMAIFGKLDDVDINSNEHFTYKKDDDYGAIYMKDENENNVLVKVLSPHLTFNDGFSTLTAEEVIQKKLEGENTIIFYDSDFKVIKFDYEVNDSVNTIGVGAFAGTRVTQVTIPSSVKKIEDLAFYKSSLGDSESEDESVIFKHDTEDKIIFGKNLFQGCLHIESIPEEYLNSLSGKIEYEFQGCESVKTVEIPIDVTEIGEGTFHDCKTIDIDINNPSIKIDKEAFNRTTPSHVKGLHFTSCESLTDADESVRNLFFSGKVVYNLKFYTKDSTEVKNL